MEKKLNGRQQTFLDLFRISAAFLVMIGHSFSFFHLTIFCDQSFFPYIQNIGVLMLFMLSGFLSTYSLNTKNTNHDYRFLDYCTHKTRRVYRELLPGLLIIAFIDYISIKINKTGYSYFEAYNIKQFVGNLLMLENMGPNGCLSNVFVTFGSGRPLWTLAVEWWLYLLFGFFYLVVSNKEKLSVFKVLQMLIIVVMISYYLITGRGAGLGFVFILGVASFYFFNRIDYLAAQIFLPLSCVGFIVYGMVIKEAYTVYSFLILWLIFCTALRIMGTSKKERGRSKVLSFISKGTFMLYLLHYSIIDFFVYLDVPWGRKAKFAVGIGASLVISYLAFYFFTEKKISGMIYRFFRKLTSHK